MERLRKIVMNLDQICGDLTRISIGYLSNTTLEQGYANPKTLGQLGS